MITPAPRRVTAIRNPRTKLSDALLQNLAKDFTEHGVGAITKMREDKPLEYMKLVLSLLPKDAIGEEDPSSSYQVVERRMVRPDDANAS